MSLELLFLGTGTSAGVPMIGCQCEVCTSHDPRDQRHRASALVRYADPTAGESVTGGMRQLLIDTAPELRLQMVRHEIMRIDGVLFTHNHADHVFGLDDLRRFNAVMDAPIALHAEQRVIDWLNHTFQYIFEPHKNINQSFIPRLYTSPMATGEPFDLFGATWTPLRLLHGNLPILGFRVDHNGASIAYCTDVSSIPPDTYPLLNDLDVLVIDALRYRHHPTHLTIDQALDVIDQVEPKRAYLTHIAHDVQHAKLEAALPEHVYAAFDGLAVNVRPVADDH